MREFYPTVILLVVFFGTLELIVHHRHVADDVALSEFVPDPPARMYTGSELVITAESAPVVEAFQPAAGPLRINSGPWVNCLHWDDSRIAFVVLANGRRVRVPCHR